MPKPVRQEDIDFVSCENDRYESEIVKRKNHQMLEALEQDAVEVQRIIYAAKFSALKKFEEAEQRLTKELQKWEQLYEKIMADYEKEKLERKLEFEAQQAQWKKEMQQMIKTQIEAEQERIRKVEEAKKQEQIDAMNKKKALEIEKQAKEKEAKEKEARMLAEAKKAQEAAQAAAEAKKKTQEATQPATGTKGSKSLGSEEALKEEERHRNMLKNIHEKLSKVPQLKTATVESRKKIKLKLNILTNSRAEILKIADEISNVLNLSKSSNINIYYFLLNFLAKELIDHAEVDILSNESSAFSFAHVSVLIAAWHTEFWNFLMARFVKKCPYVLPRYFDIREMDKMSVADFKKHIGYKDGEKEDIYIKRMCSILALYCAIMQTQSIHPNFKNPYSIDHAWTYLARLMNLRPQKITPFLLCTCIQITGAELIRVYREDALKLFSVVCKAYVLQPPPEVRALLTISPSAMSRLKTMLENASQKGGRFPYPDGRDPL